MTGVTKREVAEAVASRRVRDVIVSVVVALAVAAFLSLALWIAATTEGSAR